MVRFRRSPHVISYWRDAQVLVQNYATGRWTQGSPELCAVADTCSTWRSIGQIIERHEHLGPRTVRSLVRDLTDGDILHRSDRAAPAADQAMVAFEAWNPAAGVFHTEARNVQYRDEALFGPLPAPVGGPPPWPVKRYRTAPKVRLPNTTLDSEFSEVVLARRSWRRFGEGRIALEQVATLLRLTAGMHKFVPTKVDGLLPLRTSPSAGARHPLEVYLLALRVRGLPRGIYHYASDRHVLERIHGGVKPGRVQRYLPTQYAYDDAAAVVFFCARFDRVIGRYPYARAYRAAFVEAGHLCQTFCLTATWLGLAPFCSMALKDRQVEQDLGLDGVSESVLYAAGVGIRPTDRRDAAAPPGIKGRRPVVNPVFARVRP